MLQIQFKSLVTDQDYRSDVQERFREGFRAVQDAELNVAVSAYCFWLAIPQPVANLGVIGQDLAYIQFMHSKQYSYSLLVKKIAQFPNLLDLANALSDVVASKVVFDGEALSIPVLQDAFATLPTDIRARYK